MRRIRALCTYTLGRCRNSFRLGATSLGLDMASERMFFCAMVAYDEPADRLVDTATGVGTGTECIKFMPTKRSSLVTACEESHTVPSFLAMLSECNYALHVPVMFIVDYTLPVAGGHESTVLAFMFMMPLAAAALDGACDSSACARTRPSPSMKCSGCSIAVYCSKECQLADWPNHKRICRINAQSRRLDRVNDCMNK